MTTMNANAREEQFDAEAFERETGWSWSDAVDEAATIQRENRIFGRRRGSKSRGNGRRESFAQRFQRLTGWSYGDAVDMAAELQRERRIFGCVA